ncbi:tyrosine-type recombinase/integrase [Actinoallomurus iriomotensis]|uniref:Integrase n=1 Tax=Actinoallomurus iriomotensis TaxID=478107 RepID=A0A9W6REJ9_9ACTN|nr:tyrosine-type recombinase/integrase [Actinoallomurus iriomotensis]GLY74381.1 integrase [Actinoallomurus iriomotensis]
MTTTYDVKFWTVYRNKSSKTPSYVARWQVGGRRKTKTYRTKALAESFLSDLRQAAKRGEAFDVDTGLPESMLKAKNAATWFEFVQAYVATKWPHLAAKSRDSMTDALATVTPALTKDEPGKPSIETLRAALRRHALLPEDRRAGPDTEISAALRWLQRASLSVRALEDSSTVHAALNALSLTMDGKRAATTTYRRKRAVFYNVIEYAVELEELADNPLDRVKSKRRSLKIAQEVDRRAVVNPQQAKELLTAVTYCGRTRGEHMRAMFACMYYGGLRPAEALGLRETDCLLPGEGWGSLTLERTRPQAGKQWTDSGETHDDRGLKHRADRETRHVPIPPELVAILREHIDAHGASADGRLFRTSKGRPFAASAINGVWSQARTLAFTPAQVLSPLAQTPYDLRHAAVSLWLNAGVAAPDVAERAGHSVDVLLKVYAKCIDGQREIANRRIEAALGIQ